MCNYVASNSTVIHARMSGQTVGRSLCKKKCKNATPLVLNMLNLWKPPTRGPAIHSFTSYYYTTHICNNKLYNCWPTHTCNKRPKDKQEELFIYSIFLPKRQGDRYFQLFILKWAYFNEADKRIKQRYFSWIQIIWNQEQLIIAHVPLLSSAYVLYYRRSILYVKLHICEKRVQLRVWTFWSLIY